MAVQERVIGGGFLMIGVAIVLVLLYFFAWGGSSPSEAYDEILNDVFPAYEAGAKAGDYAAIKKQSQKLLDVLESGGRATVIKHIAAEATSGRGPASRLDKLVKSGAFEKNAGGKFGFARGWYSQRAHSALTKLADAVDNRLKILRAIRETARETHTAIAEARTGSGQPLAIPAPKSKVQDGAPIVDPNPVYEHDGALYAVFGLLAKDVEAALASKDPGGKATSARLRWNKNIAASKLGAEVAAIPERAAALGSIAAQIEASASILATLPAAADPLKALLARGATGIGSDLGEPHRAAFKKHEAAFAKGAALANVLRNELKLLDPYLSTIRPLGETLGKSFQ